QRYYVMSIGKGRLPIAKSLRWLLRRGSPLPIPNREVKPACADGTAIRGRVCRRLSLVNPDLKRSGFFVFVLFAINRKYLTATGCPLFNFKSETHRASSAIYHRWRNRLNKQ